MLGADLIGAAGVALLLGAFAANLLGMVAKESLAYPSTNFIGALLATYASWLIAYMPFVILEGVWACVSLAAIFRVISRPRPAQ
ncbi:MAG: hypothetical protein NXH87_13525 [Rhodobiaceae bacterium]|nr:hypothetical protein [Rhodobiaceae bacterium]